LRNEALNEEGEQITGGGIEKNSFNWVILAKINDFFLLKSVLYLLFFISNIIDQNETGQEAGKSNIHMI
jgi:hypothetical protein